MSEAVEVTSDVDALLRREGKRLLISTNAADGLDLRLVCALCCDRGTTVYYGDGPGPGVVRACTLCGGNVEQGDTK